MNISRHHRYLCCSLWVLLSVTTLRANGTPFIDTTPPDIIPTPADRSIDVTTPTDLTKPIVVLDLATDVLPSGLTFWDDTVPTPTNTTTADITGNIGPFTPGRHTITWTITDLGNNSDSDSHDIDVRPVVNFAVDQTIVEDAAAIHTFSAYIDQAVAWDIDIPYSVSTGNGGASEDHTAVAETITLSAGETSVNSTPFLIVDDGLGDPDETVIFTLGALVATEAIAGFKTTHTVTISESNLAPTLNLEATQNSRTTRHVVIIDGNVTLTANAIDPNPGDTLSYDWSATESSLVAVTGTTNATYVFDPLTLTPGFYTARVTVTDTNLNSSRSELLLEVISAPPTLLNTNDRDDDRLDDLAEGVKDSDSDGISDYLDAETVAHHQLQAWPTSAFQDGLFSTFTTTINNFQIQWSITSNASNLVFYPLLMTTEPGLRLGIGSNAFRAGVALGRVDDTTVNTLIGISDDSSGVVSNDGNRIDVEISDLPVVGATARLVIPQASPIPSSSPSFRIFNGSSWIDFVVDSANRLEYGAKPPGSSYCPPPGSTGYNATFTTGDDCVQLTLEDGGANDHDGVANGVIRLLGSPAVPGTPPPGGNGGGGSSGEDDPLPGDGTLRTAQPGGGGSLNFYSLLLLLATVLTHRLNRSADHQNAA